MISGLFSHTSTVGCFILSYASASSSKVSMCKIQINTQIRRVFHSKIKRILRLLLVYFVLEKINKRKETSFLKFLFEIDN